jgi:hypothetical protein
MAFKIGDTIRLLNSDKGHKDVVMAVKTYEGLQTVVYYSPVWSFTNIADFMLTSCRIVLVEKEDKRFKLYESYNVHL